MKQQRPLKLRQFTFTVNCSMGRTRYVVIGQSSEAAIDELNYFFSHDPKFKVLNVDKLSNYYSQDTKNELLTQA